MSSKNTPQTQSSFAHSETGIQCICIMYNYILYYVMLDLTRNSKKLDKLM